MRMSIEVMAALAQNPHYGKIGAASEMLKKMVVEVQTIAQAASTIVISAVCISNALATCKLGNETASTTYALYRIAMTIPSNSIPALRKRQAKDLFDGLKAKHGKKDTIIKKLLGDSLHERLEKLLIGEVFQAVDFKKLQAATTVTSFG